MERAYLSFYLCRVIGSCDQPLMNSPITKLMFCHSIFALSLTRFAFRNPNGITYGYATFDLLLQNLSITKRCFVIPTKRSAEGSLPHILIPSLRERVRERLRRGGVCPPLACIANQQFLYSTIHLPLVCCLVFFLLSLCHVLLLRKSTKTPGTRKKQSGGSLLTSRMRHSSVEPPVLKHTPLGN